MAVLIFVKSDFTASESSITEAAPSRSSGWVKKSIPVVGPLASNLVGVPSGPILIVRFTNPCR